MRWNAARSAEAVHSSRDTLRSFDVKLKDRVNQLSIAIHNKVTFHDYQPPSQYTGELLGIQYLYEECRTPFPHTDDQLDQQVDEGYADDQ